MTDAATRQSVRDRADHRCEYCRLPEVALEITFHVEHVVARQHGGSDALDNLALACDRCNFAKGPNLSSIDPQSGEVVLLFHPRHDSWTDHFRLHAGRIECLTPTGRATANLLRFNTPHRVQLREAFGPTDGA